MAHTEFILHNGTRIAHLDFTGVLDIEDGLARIAEAKRTIAQQAPGSVLTLTDVTGSRFNRDIVSSVKDMVQSNAPYVRAGAVVGLHGLMDVVFRVLARMRGGTLRSFGDLDEAKEWLATQ